MQEQQQQQQQHRITTVTQEQQQQQQLRQQRPTDASACGALGLLSPPQESVRPLLTVTISQLTPHPTPCEIGLVQGPLLSFTAALLFFLMALLYPQKLRRFLGRL